MDQFRLVRYEDIAKCTYVLNPNALSYNIAIHLDQIDMCHYALYKVSELQPEYEDDLDFASFIHHDCCHPWLDILSSWLNMIPGRHIYKFSFVNRATSDTVELFFSYIAQVDDPEKSYVYMKVTN